MECRLPSAPSKEPRISVLNSLKLEYAEADRVMIIPVDLRKNVPTGTVVETLRWDYPYHTDVVDESKKSEILGTVYDYLKVEGYSC